MTKHVNPLMRWMIDKFGEHVDFAVLAMMVKRRTGREVVADSLRLIAQGHRRPSGDLALDIETTCESEKVTTRTLLEWPHYSRVAKRAA